MASQEARQRGLHGLGKMFLSASLTALHVLDRAANVVDRFFRKFVQASVPLPFEAHQRMGALDAARVPVIASVASKGPPGRSRNSYIRGSGASRAAGM